MISLVVARSAYAQTTIYVDWNSGVDCASIPPAPPCGTSTNPYKTITWALSMVQSANTTIQVAGGTGAVYQYISGGGGESFPLTCNFDDIHIIGTRVPKPTIDLFGAENQWPGQIKAAIAVNGRTGWTIENVTISGDGYTKFQSGQNNEVQGIRVRNLPAGGVVTIEDVTILDTFHGIYVDDSGGAPANSRTLNVTDTVIDECGPVNADQNDKGHAGIRLLEAHTWAGGSHKYALNLTRCTLTNNHDALEPGSAVTTIDECMFESNENGAEIAGGVDQANIEITGSCFRTNAAFDPSSGGASAVTGGIPVRDATVKKLRIRTTDFDRNQIGISLVSATAVDADSFDFGKSFNPSDRGRNTFTTDTQNPWYQNQDHSVSYCGLFNNSDLVAHAVGNTWTYVALSPPQTPDPNQGCDNQGEFPAGSTLYVSPATNFVTGTAKPPHRPLFGQTLPNPPWNFTTGTAISGGSNPRILLVD